MAQGIEELLKKKFCVKIENEEQGNYLLEKFAELKIYWKNGEEGLDFVPCPFPYYIYCDNHGCGLVLTYGEILVGSATLIDFSYFKSIFEDKKVLPDIFTVAINSDQQVIDAKNLLENIGYNDESINLVYHKVKLCKVDVYTKVFSFYLNPNKSSVPYDSFIEWYNERLKELTVPNIAPIYVKAYFEQEYYSIKAKMRKQGFKDLSPNCADISKKPGEVCFCIDLDNKLLSITHLGVSPLIYSNFISWYVEKFKDYNVVEDTSQFDWELQTSGERVYIGPMATNQSYYDMTTGEFSIYIENIDSDATITCTDPQHVINNSETNIEQKYTINSSKLINSDATLKSVIESIKYE